MNGDDEMAFTSANLSYAAEALRDSDAIDPVIVKNTDGTFSATSALTRTDEELICYQADLLNFSDVPLDELTDEECLEFAEFIA